MNIILFGFKSSGKTHLGKLLAKKMGKKFIDTDVLIGPNYRELFLEWGEKKFREKECEVVSSLDRVTDSVIATGGGTLLEKKNFEVLEKIGVLIYLDVPKEILRARLGKYENFDEVYEKRRHVYENIPSKRIEIGEKNEDEILWEIIRLAKFSA